MAACVAIAASLAIGVMFAGGDQEYTRPLYLVGAILVPLLGVSLIFVGIRVVRRSFLQVDGNALSTIDVSAPEQVSLRYVFIALTLLAILMAIARWVQNYNPFIDDAQFWLIVLMGVILLLFACIVTVLVAEVVLREWRIEMIFVLLLGLSFAVYFFPNLFFLFLNSFLAIPTSKQMLDDNRAFFFAFSASFAVFLWPLRLCGARLRYVKGCT